MVVNVKHTLCHAGHFVAIVGTQVVLPTLEITVEAAHSIRRRGLELLSAPQLSTATGSFVLHRLRLAGVAAKTNIFLIAAACQCASYLPYDCW